MLKYHYVTILLYCTNSILLVLLINIHFPISANIQNTQNDILLYIGLTVAIFLICFLSFFVVKIYRKKGQHQSLYNMASNGK